MNKIIGWEAYEDIVMNVFSYAKPFKLMQEEIATGTKKYVMRIGRRLDVVDLDYQLQDFEYFPELI